MALADARGDLERAKSVLAARQAEFDNENAGLAKLISECGAEIKGIEADIRGRGYSADDRAPAPGLTVKVVTQIAYDPEVARDWAIGREHWNLLSLDAKAFERVAVGLRPDFVTVARVPTGSIARDLSEARAAIGAEMDMEEQRQQVEAMLRGMRKTVDIAHAIQADVDTILAEPANLPGTDQSYMATMLDAEAEAIAAGDGAGEE